MSSTGDRLAAPANERTPQEGGNRRTRRGHRLLRLLSGVVLLVPHFLVACAYVLSCLHAERLPGGHAVVLRSSCLPDEKRTTKGQEADNKRRRNGQEDEKTKDKKRGQQERLAGSRGQAGVNKRTTGGQEQDKTRTRGGQEKVRRTKKGQGEGKSTKGEGQGLETG